MVKLTIKKRFINASDYQNGICGIFFSKKCILLNPADRQLINTLYGTALIDKI
jgi:hypothetical protein